MSDSLVQESINRFRDNILYFLQDANGKIYFRNALDRICPILKGHFTISNGKVNPDIYGSKTREFGTIEAVELIKKEGGYSGKIVTFDHLYPVDFLFHFLKNRLSLYKNNKDLLLQDLKQYCVSIVITKEQEKCINRAEVKSSMPKDRMDLLARPDVAGFKKSVVRFSNNLQGVNDIPMLEFTFVKANNKYLSQ